MRVLEDEFVDDSVDADGSTDKFQFCVCGVAEDKVFTVEFCERCAADATCHLKDA